MTRRKFQADIEHVMTLFPRLKERAKQLAGTLSGGEQQKMIDSMEPCDFVQAQIVVAG